MNSSRARSQVAAIRFDQTLSVGLGLLIPACAALGDVIRSVFWPKGASALAFACATLFSSSAVLAILSPSLASPSNWSFAEPSLRAWFGAYVLASSLSYVLNLRLQKVAGPVVFSQIGYWRTGFGVLLTAGLFGDVLTAMSLGGLLAIILGGVLANHRRTDHP